MEKLIECIKNFSKLEMNLLLDAIFDGGEERHVILFQVLKALPESEKEECMKLFYAFINPKWLNERISETESASAELLEKHLFFLMETIETFPEKVIEIEKNTAAAKQKCLEYREVMKAGWKETVKTDQMDGVPFPPVQKSLDESQELILLPQATAEVVKKQNIFDCINNRASRRKFTTDEISLAELSFLLWATQGLKDQLMDGKLTRRTVPSGGSRHPFETYLVVNHVTGLKEGVYRYQPMEHGLVYLFDIENRQEKTAKAALEQSMAGECAVCFVWSVIPYRCEWRYMLESKKIILQDSGHLCQNLYLACEALDLGTCAIGAYDQKLFDELIRLDGKEEFTVYVAPVGVPAKK
ncbi:MAG TPA: SagB/ThcOx family dehydrogenase [Candidatus Cloacimonadota bacterium]|nr:SagB/ThcOx family dehydrogenase [Candidatus Cloacimonadota bacterium]